MKAGLTAVEAQDVVQDTGIPAVKKLPGFNNVSDPECLEQNPPHSTNASRLDGRKTRLITYKL